MPLQIVRNDITKMKVDAIVNAANESLLGGGGVDGCIHRAAGPELLAECETLHGCKTGSAKITKGYKLPCKYVIHAVGPRWYDGRHGECELLISCYRTSLMLAKEYGCESIAFPLISSGIFGYPKDQALKVAIDTISSFLLENEMTVYIVIFDRKAYQISGKLFADIAAYIDDRYVDEHTDPRSERLRRMSAFRMEEPMPCESSVCDEDAIEQLIPPVSVAAAPKKASTLDDALEQIDESFSEMLLRKIDERGMTDAQRYKKANIDRKLFSKIRSDKLYKPSKPTAIAFAIALELPLAEMKDKTKEREDGSIEQIDQKHIMRYQQFFAAMIVRQRISEGTTSGIIWHTQGSGKTALSYHLSYVLTDYFSSVNRVTKFYFIVDRLDLMKQAKEEFEARGLVVKTANSRSELMDQFRTNQSQEGTTGEPEITVVNIQRFEERQDKVVLPAYATNLQRVFIIDEAHRGYKPEGSFLSNLFDADPNSIKIALTGTPLLKSERESWRVFGNYLHTY